MASTISWGLAVCGFMGGMFYRHSLIVSPPATLIVAVSQDRTEPQRRGCLPRAVVSLPDSGLMFVTISDIFTELV